MSDHNTCLHRKKGHDSNAIHNAAPLAITCMRSITNCQLVSPLGGRLDIKNEYIFDQRPCKGLIIKMCLMWAILIQLGYALEQKNDPFVIAMSEGVEHRFTSDKALDCRYLRWKGADAVPHALSLFWSHLRLECIQDYVVNRHGGLKGVRGTQSPVEGYLSKCRTKIETELETGE